MTVQITMLNAMASPDFAAALDFQRDRGLKLLDLKDAILGRSLLDLTDAEAAQAAEMIDRRGLKVYCLSSVLFHADVEQGGPLFTAGLDDRVARLIELARLLRPQVLRLLGATTSRRDQVADAVAEVEQRHPWLIAAYQQAIDRIADAGFMATIENEVRGCILSSPAEVQRLFALINRPGRVMFTWDAQNMWQAGTFPTVAVYEQLRDLTGYVHLKGGQSVTTGGPLAWRCALEDAGYDVPALVQHAVASGRVAVICLNPPHGQPKPGYDYTNLLERDLRYVRQLIQNATSRTG